MFGFLLIIPFFLIRFILLSCLNKDAVARAAYFAPLQKNEHIVYYTYQLSQTLILIYLFFISIKIDISWMFYLGMGVYLMGIGFLTISIIHFATSPNDGLNIRGIYKFSRNPMYVSYFVYFIGCVLLTQSFSLFVIVIIFQISAHWIILSEERWCIQKFHERYIQYMKEVRRYI